MNQVEVLVDEEQFKAAGERQRRKLRGLSRRLQQEPFMGDRIRRALVPSRFKDLPNLLRLELPDGWRALYTVASNPTKGTQIRIIWVGDRTVYDRLFGYG